MKNRWYINNKTTENDMQTMQVVAIEDINSDLDQYQTAEEAIISYYDKKCLAESQCGGCKRNVSEEKRIAKSYGIKDFESFEYLLMRDYY